MPDVSDEAAGPASEDAASVHLDLAGLKCPLPALRTRKALRALPPGARLVVTATDPLAGLDIPNVVREEGARIESQTRNWAGLRESAETSDRPASWRFVIRAAG